MSVTGTINRNHTFDIFVKNNKTEKKNDKSSSTFQVIELRSEAK